MIPTSPSTELYTLGKGILEIAEWNGSPGSYTDVGNCPSMTALVTEEELPHYSSRSGTREKDKVFIIETGYTLEFDLDEKSVYNLKMFLRATVTLGHKLHANQALNKEYAIKFTSTNTYGPNEIWEFWKAKITPRGAFNLISDDVSTLVFTAEGLTDRTNHPNSPFFDVNYITTTSTTTSSSTTTSTTASV